MRRLRHIFLSCVLFTITLTAFFAPIQSVFAQEVDPFGIEQVGEGSKLGKQDLVETIQKIIDVALGLLGVIAVVIILYGGFVYMTSGGDEEKILVARKMMINATIGLAIILSSFAIARFIIYALSDAVGVENQGSEVVASDPCAPGANYNEALCADLCDTYAGLSTCKNTDFFVRSISPSTPKGNTGMHNLLVRAVFSQKVKGSNNDLASALGIKKGGDGITPIISKKEDGYVIEAVLPAPACTTKDPATAYLWINIAGTFGKLPITFTNIADTKKWSITSPLDTAFTFDLQLTPNTIPPTPAAVPGVSTPHIFVSKPGSFFLWYNPAPATNIPEVCAIAVTDFDAINSSTKDSQAACVPVTLTAGKSYHVVAVKNDMNLSVTVDGKTTAITMNKPMLQNANPVSVGGVDGPYFISWNLNALKFLNQPLSTTEAELLSTGGLQAGAGATCLADGQYTTTISDKLVSENNDQILTKPKGFANTEFPLSATFTVPPGIPVIDKKVPEIKDVTIVGPAGSAIQAGKPYQITATVLDNTPATPYGGVAYVKLEIQKNGNTIETFFDGPRVTTGSSEPFAFEHSSIAWTKLFSGGGAYTLVLSVYDIDSNSVVYTKDLTVFGANCDKFGNPLPGAAPGECPVSGVYCESDATCPLDNKCVQNICTPWPTILSIDPLDGAPGNWVTIQGVHFGEEDGKVGMAIDANNDASLSLSEETWLPVALASCGKDVWHDEWIVAEVPDLNALKKGEDGIYKKVAIRIETAADPNKFDTTHDDHSIQAIPLFEVNETKRPKLCSVTSDGKTAASSQSSVQAVGDSFGAGGTGSRLLFGTVQSNVSSWNESLILGTVPPIELGNNQSKEVGVMVEVNGVKSNGLPFSVISDTDLLQPIITDVDPLSAGKGSYVTLFGKGFGTSGVVYLSSATSAEAAREACGKADTPNPSVCIPMSQVFPEGCPKTWSATQAIVIVPEMAVGSYHIVLKNNSGFYTSGVNTFTVTNAPPSPGICAIVPQSSYAPLITLETGTPTGPLTIKGENLTQSNAPTTIYLWGKESVKDNMTTWLPVSSPLFTNQASEKNTKTFVPGLSSSYTASWNATSLTTLLPVNQSGDSKRTGPVQVFVGQQKSNMVQHQVIDCALSGVGTKELYQQSGYACCSEGPDKGAWKHTSTAPCAGTVRESGYVWRFTSGKIAQIPKVTEYCTDDGVSPTPWVGHTKVENQGKNACLNAEVQVYFTIPIAKASITNGLEVYSCGSENEIDCSNNKQVLTGEFVIKTEASPASTNFIKLEWKDKAKQFNPNTWYRVQLSDGITSYEVIEELGFQKIETIPLAKTRPCGNGTAYCFEFKTGTGQCKLVGANVLPKVYTAPALGAVLKLYPFGEQLFYTVQGKTDKACVTMNVSSLDWAWDTEDALKASVIEVLDDETQASAEALQEAPEGVAIRAKTTPPEGAPITGLGTLFIALGQPKVIQWEPNCLESCVNATISATFNQKMKVDTYQTGVMVQKCVDGPDCLGNLPNVTQVKLDPASTDTKIVLSLEDGALLEPSTYYKVTLDQTIYSLGSLDIEANLPGKPLESFSWVFKTNDNSEPCVADRVDIIPITYTAKKIAEKNLYTAQPYSSANKCSAIGQALSKWSYSYSWKSANTKVATITSVPQYAAKPAFCTFACLPAGSAVSFSNKSMSLCGNGIMDAGEDCDIASANEKPGVSCSYMCLRPGNTNAGQSANQCGNGSVDILFGEQCDPQAVNTPPGSCSSTCLKTGTTKTPPVGQAGPTTGFCGDGFVSTAETCDPKSSIGPIGCGPTCLKTGTPIAVSWCVAEPALSDAATAACAGAYSVCGNGTLEGGEECEINAQKVLPEYCSDACLFKADANLCSLPDQKQCNTPGENGCDNNCQFSGSSLLYTTASICGDSIKGLGEHPSCEVTGLASQSAISPIQIATAIGQEETFVTLPNNTKGQQTNITVSIANTTNVADDGAYALQCSFEEYVVGVPKYGGGQSWTEYNSCADNKNNSLGVGTNTCCYERPVRQKEFPEDGTGLDNTKPACPNTLITVDMPGEIDPTSLTEDTVYLVSGHEAGYVCSTHGGTNVTTFVKSLILEFISGDLKPLSFFDRVERLVASVVSWVRDLFGGTSVHAATIDSDKENVAVWCTTPISLSKTVSYTKGFAGTIVKTQIGLTVSDLLDFSRVYGVVLEGGRDGIRNTAGVTIKNKIFSTRDDLFLFKTGTEICKIDHVTVVPANQLFTVPNQSHDITAYIETKDNTPIVSTAAYSWFFEWEPSKYDILPGGGIVYKELPVFDLPAGQDMVGKGSPTSTLIAVAAKNVEGQMTAYGIAAVTKDVSVQGNQIGKSFAGKTELYADFCENPWPDRAVYPYEDMAGNNDAFLNGAFTGEPAVSLNNAYTNFRMSYCADAGQSGVVSDDLPYLKPILFTDEFDLGAQQVTPATVFGDITADHVFNQTDISCFQTITTDGNSSCLNVPLTQVDFDCDAAITSLDLSAAVKLLAYKNKSESDYAALLQFYDANNNKIIDCQEKTASSIKRFLFPNDINSDVIGIEVFKNPDRLTAKAWFEKQFPSGKPFQVVTIGGYDGVSDGTSYYINALNDPSGQGDGTIFNNIYLLSINPDAEQSTRTVFESILSSFALNTNIEETGVCYDPTTETADYGLVCSSDFDCLGKKKGTVAVASCSQNKTQLLRDWQRVRDIQSMQKKADTYFVAESDAGGFKDTFKADLAGGSFLKNYTNSRWPSWGLLSSILGGFPQDPLNLWGACSPDADAQTCWNSAAKTYSCPATSHVYEYQFHPQDSNVNLASPYTLSVPLEYFHSSAATVATQFTSFISPNTWENNQSCIPETVVSDGPGVCGDGVKNTGEACDPPGSSSVAVCATDATKNQLKSCNASCQYELGACYTVATCDNGIVEGSEVCDDGAALNGTYGHCADNCQALTSTAGYCGNGKKDGANEYCENVSDIQFAYKFSNTEYARVSCKTKFVSLIDPKTCTGACQFFTGIVVGVLAKPCVEYTGHCSLDSSLLCNSNADCIAPPSSLGPPAVLTSATVGDFLNKKSVILGSTNYGSCLQGAEQVFGASYSVRKENTCNWNCQAPGAYCGDGLVDNQYETCDDGNAVSGDGCSSECILEVAPLPVCGNGKIESGEACDDGNAVSGDSCSADCKTGVPINAVCGNAKIEDGEACDEGAKNGLACLPTYGTKCTYCSSGCDKILTKETEAFCGNGKIDEVGKKADGTALFEVCDTKVVDGQTQVVVSENAPVCNENLMSCVKNTATTLLSCSDKGPITCGSCQALVKGCVSCTVQANKPKPKLALLNPLDLDGAKEVSLSYKTTSQTFQSTVTYAANGYTKLVNMTQNNGFETSAYCANSYSYTLGAGDTFSFPVNNEVGNVVNTAIYTPPLQSKNRFTVVVRWTPGEVPFGPFVGGVYSTALSPQFNLFGSLYGQADVTGPCTKMIKDGEYWIPDILSPQGQEKCGLFSGPKTSVVMYNTQNDGLIKQPFNVGPTTYIQSSYIEAEDKKPIAFFVQSIGGSPIAAVKNSQLSVELYGYHAGKKQGDIMKPIQTFSISGAGKSSNAKAKYWHVFNLVYDETKKEYGVQTLNSVGTVSGIAGTKDGSIETCDCWIKENINDATQTYCSTSQLAACQ